MRVRLYLYGAIIIIGGQFLLGGSEIMEAKGMEKTITLPAAKFDERFPLVKAIKSRRSVRRYKNEALSLEQISQLLWAAQGITSKDGLRAAPSAGALYPMELYVVVGKVDVLSPGIYKYNCKSHTLSLLESGDKRSELSSASLRQDAVANGMINIVICGVFERTRAKYGSRAKRYVFMEAGHVAQNIYLLGTSLGLGTVVVGAFDDESVKKVIKAQPEEHPLYVMPVGKL